jgi:hypothetical protein
MATASRRKTHAPRTWRRASALYLRAEADEEAPGLTGDQGRPLRRRERKALARMRRVEMRLFGRTVS